jgi:hypothetical protein
MTPNRVDGNAWVERLEADRRAEKAALRLARQDRIERRLFAAGLVFIWLLAAAVLGFKEMQWGMQALPVYLGEMVYMTILCFIGWHHGRD